MAYPDDRKTRPPLIASEMEAIVRRIARVNPEPGTRLIEQRLTYGDTTDGGGHYDYDFINLLDTPSTYAGAAGKFVKVKQIEDGLEFSGSAGSKITVDQSGNLANSTYTDLSGTIDGANTTFTVSTEIYTGGSLLVFHQGQELEIGAGNDYVETTPGSGIFDLNTAPASGDVLIALYGDVTADIYVDQSGGTGSRAGVLTGAINGANTTYTVSKGFYDTGSLVVLLNGQVQTQGTGGDWTETTVASGTFDFAIAPPTGSKISVIYHATVESGLIYDADGDISGARNGVNTDYTLSKGYRTGKVVLFLNGQKQNQGSDLDYEELNPESGTVRFNTAPPTSSVLSAVYELWDETDPATAQAGINYAVRAISANYTTTLMDQFIMVDASSGAVTVTIPAATDKVGKYYHIKKTDSSANAVNVTATGGDRIDGQVTQTLAAQYDNMPVVAQGGLWHIF